MNKLYLLLGLTGITLTLTSAAKNSEFFMSDFLDKQKTFPVKIAENNISTSHIEFNTSIDFNNNLIMFTRAGEGFNGTELYQARWQGDKFSEAELIKMAGTSYQASDISLSADGKQLLFSMYSDENGKGSFDLFVSQKINEQWSQPKKLSSQVNSATNEFYPQMTQSKNLYFARAVEGRATDIFVSTWTDGKYQNARPVSENINSEIMEADAYVSPDETYMIFARMKPVGGLGVTDLFISFNQNGNWTKPVNMGPEINSKGVDGSPFVSIDGEYLFFTSNRDSDNPEKFDGALDLYVTELDIEKYRINRKQ